MADKKLKLFRVNCEGVPEEVVAVSMAAAWREVSQYIAIFDVEAEEGDDEDSDTSKSLRILK